jgi:nicotinamide-nucleotide amidase
MFANEVIVVIDERLINKISKILKKQKLSVATAESCTGGLVAHTLTNISGSSGYFDRGVISYSNKSKIQLLDVPKDLLIKHGAVSKEVAKAMANGIRTKSDVGIGISTTGIAGPTGGTEEKPVGLVYIAVSTKDDTRVEKFLFTGNRLQNKENTCEAALEMLLNILNG